VNTNPLEQEAQGRECHYRWLPTLAVEPGMVTARPVVGLVGARETMYISIGSTMTASTIAQLMAKDVACVAVIDPLPPDYSDSSRVVARFQDRLKEIFGPAPDAACQALMDALMLAQPTLC
jgi:hypothetical protein